MTFFIKTYHSKGFSQRIPYSWLLNNKLRVTQEINSPAFVESKGSLSCSQQSTTGPVLSLKNIPAMIFYLSPSHYLAVSTCYSHINIINTQ